MHTRQDYMTGVCTHNEFWSQYVNDHVIRTVCWLIGEARIKASTDEHFNDIPLREWDAMHNIVKDGVARKNREVGAYGVDETRLFVSLSDTGCALKAAARQIRGH